MSQKNIGIPKALSEQIDKAVKDFGFQTNAELVRYAVRKYLEEKYGEQTDI
jgi:metal-responsive CopG/Arc/MetJ family transcriptional regulator